MITIIPVPVQEFQPAEIFGWRNARITSLAEGFAQSGQPKLTLELTLIEPAYSGRVVRGHLSLAEFPRAIALLHSMKKSLNLPTTEPFQDFKQLVGRELRIQVVPWITNKGETRESVSDFAPMQNEYSATDTLVTASPVEVYPHI